jgi:homoaconitase/3-isopropylmalate dehydratase large subunit
VEKRKNLVPGIKVIKGGQIELAHQEHSVGLALLLESCGTADVGFLSPLLGQLANVTSKGQEISEADLNFLLSVIRDIKPRDQLEAMLASQMACVHIASMTFARRMNHTQTTHHQDSAVNAYNKLLRTFTSQMEALRKYRTGGEQKVTVQHVQVNEGGQAIVGNVSHNSSKGGGGAG